MKEGGDGWWRWWGLQTKLMSWHSLKETCHPFLSWCFFALHQAEQVILFTKNKIQIEFIYLHLIGWNTSGKFCQCEGDNFLFMKACNLCH